MRALLQRMSQDCPLTMAASLQLLEENEVPGTQPMWCICGCCRPIPDKPRMEFCCGQTECVTKNTSHIHLTRPDIVEVAGLLCYADTFHEEPKRGPNLFRNQAYHFFILWQHGKLGKGNRRCPPACVVSRTRMAYPNPPGVPYTGYQSFDEDEFD